jgi:hypothetical protein
VGGIVLEGTDAMPYPYRTGALEHRPKYEQDKEANVWRAYCETDGCTWHREYAGRGAIIRAVAVHRRTGKDND